MAEVEAPLVLEEVAVVETNGNQAVTAEPEVCPPMRGNGLYAVRVPKPIVAENATGERKKLLEKLQVQVTALKAMNAKLSSKRDEVKALRKQMSEARALKEMSEPEYQGKLSAMKQLQQARNGYKDRIAGMKDDVKSLECKSESELNEKIRSLEHKIAHEGLILREEKQAVAQINKLNQQRAKVREFDLSKGTLSELENERQKVQSIIADMDGEFNVIKSERDATNKVLEEIYHKLNVAREELENLEKQHKILQEAKEAESQALDSLRGEADSSMSEYREYRKFSLTVRDLMASGQLEEARALVDAQVNEAIPKLCQDAVYRKEYQALWCGQRKYQVSELLPGTSVLTTEAAAAAGRGGAGGRGGRGGPVRVPPPEPRGAEKAKDIIEQLMAKASSNAATARAAAAATSGEPIEDDGEAEVAINVKVAKPAASTPFVPASSVFRPASATIGSGKPMKFAEVELPKMVTEVEFVLPPREEAVAGPTKEELREEQIRKAAEAEERKRRRNELAERKRLQAGDAAKRLEAERRERDTAGRVAAAATKAGALAPMQQQVTTDDSTAEVGTTSAPTNVQQPKPTAFEKKQMIAQARRPKQTKTTARQAHGIWEQHQGWIVLGIVLAITVVLIYFFVSE